MTSNQRCANDWIFESKLRGGALKIFFQQYRPKGAADRMGGGTIVPGLCKPGP